MTNSYDNVPTRSTRQQAANEACSYNVDNDTNNVKPARRASRHAKVLETTLIRYVAKAIHADIYFKNNRITRSYQDTVKLIGAD